MPPDVANTKGVNEAYSTSLTLLPYSRFARICGRAIGYLNDDSFVRLGGKPSHQHCRRPQKPCALIFSSSIILGVGTSRPLLSRGVRAAPSLHHDKFHSASQPSCL